MHPHFATICSRITRFSPKCSETITVYQSMQNLYQLVEYSLIKNRNWIHVMTERCEHDTSDSCRWLLIKTLQTGKRLNCWKKWSLSFQRDS